VIFKSQPARSDDLRSQGFSSQNFLMGITCITSHQALVRELRVAAFQEHTSRESQVLNV
jgi:hypothetical protein